MNRLLNGAGTSYSYDEIGNITASTGVDPASFTYASAGGQDSMLMRSITRSSTQSVSDDVKRGWITGIDTRYSNLKWDVFGRLEAIVDLARGQSGTQQDTYRYYPDGLRYRKDETATTGAVTTSLYLYEGNDILLKEMLEGTTWKTAQVNVRLGGQEIGRYVKDYVGGTERLEYVWLDTLGSRRAVADTAASIKAKIDYSVWGTPTVTNYNGYDGSLDVSYTGKGRDSTGLYYFNARYYDLLAGRFYSEDSVKDGMNWFVYCGNNPLSATDPTGLTNVSTMLRGRELVQDGQGLQVTGLVIVAGTIIEDIATGGAGVLDDSATVSLGMTMIRSGWNLKNLGQTTLEAGVVEGNILEPGSNNAARVRDIFASLPDGKSKGVKVVKSVDELQSLFNSLADGGALDESRANYKGVAVELPDGTKLGYRLDSKSSGPAIIIQFPGSKTQYKVHLP
jgi:RHS repeat-associated protein